MRPTVTRWALLSAFLLLASPHPARSESGGPAEFAPGEEQVRRLPRAERSARVTQSRALARAQRAEMDSLAALLAAEPSDPRRLHRQIEAVKRRHAREEIALHHEFALRTGNLSLARRLEARLARLAESEGAAR